MESAERVLSLWELVEEQLVNFAEWVLDFLEWVHGRLVQFVSGPVRLTAPHPCGILLYGARQLPEPVFTTTASRGTEHEHGVQPRPNQDLFKKNDDLCSPHARSETAFLDYYTGPVEHTQHPDISSPTARQAEEAHARRTNIPEKEYAGRIAPSPHQPSAVADTPWPPIAPSIRHSTLPQPHSLHRPDPADHAAIGPQPAHTGGFKPGEARRARTFRARSDDTEHHLQAIRAGVTAAVARGQPLPPHVAQQLQAAPQQPLGVPEPGNAARCVHPSSYHSLR